MEHKPSKMEKIITFKVANYWFALPMAAILKVVHCPSPNQGGVTNLGIVQLGKHTIQLLDLHRVFGVGQDADSLKPAKFLLALRTKKLWGIALETPPDLVELPRDQFKPVAADRRFTPNKQWISHIAVMSNEHIDRTLLLLDLKAIFQMSP